MTLEEIRKIFPKVKYAPKPDCKHCGGTGVNEKASKIAEKQNLLKRAKQPCICVFVDHEFSDEARKLLGENFDLLSQRYVEL